MGVAFVSATEFQAAIARAERLEAELAARPDLSEWLAEHLAVAQRHYDASRQNDAYGGAFSLSPGTQRAAGVVAWLEARLMEINNPGHAPDSAREG